MGEPITVLNFDHVYEEQDFYRKEKYTWIDLTDVSGVNGYCDSHAMAVLRKRLRQRPHARIHFIDSGNYHYVTYLLLEYIREPFALVLFDHHTDMQQPLFEELLSCGCWVRRTLEEHKYLQEVIMIGLEKRQLEAIDPAYRKRITAYSRQTVEESDVWEEFAARHIHYPVYISIDKDVIDTGEAATNWDQGGLTLKQLNEVYGKICRNHRVLGIDVCGESADYLGMLERFEADNSKNNQANEKILHMIEEKTFSS